MTEVGNACFKRVKVYLFSIAVTWYNARMGHSLACKGECPAGR